jgi:hypothetical protein
MQRYLEIVIRKIDIKNNSAIDNSRKILIRYNCVLRKISIIDIIKDGKIFKKNLKN